MKYAIIFLSSFLLAGCASMNVPSEPSHAPQLSTSDVVKPFKANPNVVEASAQLQSSYSAGSAQVLRVGNEIKVTYASDALFGVGGEELLAGSESTLAPLVKVAKAYPQASVRIDCFTDTSGSPEQNFVHSEERAQSVMRYLVSGGVVADKISLKGYGGDYPVADNTTADGRRLNRHVVITLSNIPSPPPVV